MYYDDWLRAPYMVENPHYEGCDRLEEDHRDDADCTCLEIIEQLRSDVADDARNLALEP